MVRGSLTAFSRSDSSVAKRVFEKDKEFDALYGAVFAKLTSLAKDPDRVAHDTKLAFLSKDLNEISEHATNIAEVVMFMVDGKEITHMDMHERRTPRRSRFGAEDSIIIGRLLVPLENNVAGSQSMALSSAGAILPAYGTSCRVPLCVGRGELIPEATTPGLAPAAFTKPLG